MSDKKQETLRERMERIWLKRRPNPNGQTEFTAEDKKTPTPERDEFFGNLEKAAEEQPHPRGDQNGE